MDHPLMIVCPHCSATNRVPRTRLGESPTCGRCKQALFTGHPAELDRAGFEAQLAHNDIPLVVDFWAPWCGPCRMMAPAFAQAARELEPRYRLAKVNTDNEQGIAAQLGIRSIPTLIVFRNGREVARQAGALDAARLVRWVSGSA